MLLSEKFGVCIQPDTTGPLAQTTNVDKAMRLLGLRMFRIRAPIVGTDS